MVASLKEEMKLTKSVQVKRADVEKLASRFLEEYQSSVDESGITAGLLKRIESAFKRTCRIRGVRQAEPASLPSPSSARRPLIRYAPPRACKAAFRSSPKPAKPSPAAIRPAQNAKPPKESAPNPRRARRGLGAPPFKSFKKRPAGPRGFTALQNPCTGCAGQWRALAPEPSGNPCRR